MTSQTLTTLLSKEISDLFDETFEQVSGIYLDKGTSLFETLETITAEQASRPVSATCASIAGQVDHVSFYIDVLVRYLRGEEVEQIDWDASWCTQAVTTAEWATLLGQVRDSYRVVRELTSDVTSWEIEGRLGDTLAIIVHTAYHLGEIRQALCTVQQ